MDSSRLDVLADMLTEAGFSEQEVERVRLALRPGSLVLAREAQEHLDTPDPSAQRQGREIAPGLYAADHVYWTATCSTGERRFLDIVRQQRLALANEARNG